MGKGDRKTRKGKLFRGSYGNRRLKKKWKKELKRRKKLHCYNCGVELIPSRKAHKMNPKPPNAQTREHIPQASLYEGYSKNYTQNRITVSGCAKCNNQFSKIDAEIRDVIGVKNVNNPNQIELSKKAARSIMKKGNWQDKVGVSINGQVTAVDFSYDDLRKIHIKNFKGLFYKKYGYSLPNDFSVEIIAEGNTEVDAAKAMFSFLDQNGGWKESGHESIFRYKLTPFKSNDNQVIVPTENVDDSLGILGVLDYHKEEMVIVVAAKQKLLQSAIIASKN